MARIPALHSLLITTTSAVNAACISEMKNTPNNTKNKAQIKTKYPSQVIKKTAITSTEPGPVS